MTAFETASSSGSGTIRVSGLGQKMSGSGQVSTRRPGVRSNSRSAPLTTTRARTSRSANRHPGPTRTSPSGNRWKAANNRVMAMGNKTSPASHTHVPPGQTAVPSPMRVA